MAFIRGQNTTYFSWKFDFKIWFRAQVIGSFEKQAPGLQPPTSPTHIQITKQESYITLSQSDIYKSFVKKIYKFVTFGINFLLSFHWAITDSNGSYFLREITHFVHQINCLTGHVTDLFMGIFWGQEIVWSVLVKVSHSAPKPFSDSLFCSFRTCSYMSNFDPLIQGYF